MQVTSFNARAQLVAKIGRPCHYCLFSGAAEVSDTSLYFTEDNLNNNINLERFQYLYPINEDTATPSGQQETGLSIEEHIAII